MINFETYHEVRRLSRELNLTPSQIAAETGLNIKTIRKWLDKPRYEPRSKATRRTSKLDAYKDLIVCCWKNTPTLECRSFSAYVPNTVTPAADRSFMTLFYCHGAPGASPGIPQTGLRARRLHAN